MKLKKSKIKFDILCEEVYDKLLLYLYNTLRSKEIAYDCVQETFLIALEKQDVLKKHPNPEGSLFQTAKNLSRKYWRESFQKLKRECSFSEQELIFKEQYMFFKNDEDIDETILIDKVLDQLNKEKRTLYALYYLDGYSLREIAIKYQIQEPALRMRYVRLRCEIIEIVQKTIDKEIVRREKSG